jgi:hypothetical protein
LESGGSGKPHFPSIVTLSKFAEAVGCRLEIKLIPDQNQKSPAKFSKE